MIIGRLLFQQYLIHFSSPLLAAGFNESKGASYSSLLNFLTIPTCFQFVTCPSTESPSISCSHFPRYINCDSNRIVSLVNSYLKSRRFHTYIEDCPFPFSPHCNLTAAASLVSISISISNSLSSCREEQSRRVSVIFQEGIPSSLPYIYQYLHISIFLYPYQYLLTIRLKSPPLSESKSKSKSKSKSSCRGEESISADFFIFFKKKPLQVFSTPYIYIYILIYTHLLG